MPKRAPTTPIVELKPASAGLAAAVSAWLADTRRRLVERGLAEVVENPDGTRSYVYRELTDEEQASGEFPLAEMEIDDE